jgi:hypothetical protein
VSVKSKSLAGGWGWKFEHLLLLLTLIVNLFCLMSFKIFALKIKCIKKINKQNYMTFLIYNAKISDNNAESGKVPRMLAAFPR